MAARAAIAAVVLLPVTAARGTGPRRTAHPPRTAGLALGFAAVALLAFYRLITLAGRAEPARTPGRLVAPRG